MICVCSQPTEELLKQHYSDLAGKPFFPGLVKYMSSGPVIPMVIIHFLSLFYPQTRQLVQFVHLYFDTLLFCISS